MGPGFEPLRAYSSSFVVMTELELFLGYYNKLRYQNENVQKKIDIPEDANQHISLINFAEAGGFEPPVR